MCFSSGVYLISRILMYVKRHEQIEIGCGAILIKLFYYYNKFCFVVEEKPLWVSQESF